MAGQLEVLLSLNKGPCAHSTDSQTLTASVCRKVRVYLQGIKQGSGRRAPDLLQPHLRVGGVF